MYLVKSSEGLEYRNSDVLRTLPGIAVHVDAGATAQVALKESVVAMIRALPLLLFAPPLASAQGYTIAGVAENPGGEPAKRLRVAIAPVENRECETSVVTREDGRFRFDGLPAGKFQLMALSSGRPITVEGAETRKIRIELGQ